MKQNLQPEPAHISLALRKLPASTPVMGNGAISTRGYDYVVLLFRPLANSCALVVEAHWKTFLQDIGAVHQHTSHRLEDPFKNRYSSNQKIGPSKKFLKLQ